MVRTSLAIERDVEDEWSIRDIGDSAKTKENQSSSSSRKKQKTFALYEFQGRATTIRAEAESGLLAKRSR